MQQLIEMFRSNALHRGRSIDQLLARHVDRDAYRGRAGAFAGARLQHPKFAALDRKFTVLHVSVMLLEQLRDGIELLVNFRQLLLELADRIWRARARDYVFALRVQKVFAVKFLLAGGWIAGEGDPGAAVLAHVAKHHRLHVDGSTQIIGNAIDASIIDGAAAHP